MKTTLKTAKFTFKTAFARCVAAKILCENGKMYAVFGGFMIDCGIFCRGCGGFYVFFKRLQGLFAVKMRCGNGKNMVRRWQNCGAKMVKMWCICGVYMLDFLHFCCQCGEMVVRLRRFLCVIQAFARFICGKNAVRKQQNSVRKWRNCGAKMAKLWCGDGENGGVFSACTCLISCIFVAKVAKWWCDCGGWWCDCGGWWCDCGGFYVFFRRLQSLFAVKMRCKNGKIVVRRWRNGGAKWRKCGAEMVVGICNFG